MDCDMDDVSSFFKESGLLYLITALISLSVGVYLNNIIVGADIIQKSSSNWSNDSGYTSEQFYACMIAMWLLPIGLMALLIFVVRSYKGRWNTYGKLTLYISLLVGSILCCYYSYHIGEVGEILECGVLCNGPETTKHNGKYGITNALGIMYFFFSVGFTVLFTYLTYSVIYNISMENKDTTHDDEIQPLMNNDNNKLYVSHFYNKIQYNKYTRFFIIICVLILLYPLFLLLSISLPTWWQHFDIYYIHNYELSEPSKDYGPYWKIHVNQYYVMKVFPDILVYYGSIYLVCTIAILANYIKSFKRFLHTRINNIPYNLSIGELLLFTLLTGLLFFQFFYFYYDHQWEKKYNTTRTPGMHAEIAARALGQVCNLIMGLLVLPVSRNSFWTIIFGVSWESLIWYHTWLGGLFLIAISLHMFTWWHAFDMKDSFPHDIIAIPTTYHTDNFTIPLAEITQIFIYIFMGIFTLYYIRRNNYEIFYYLHHFAIIIFLLLLWHATMSWYYVAPGLVLYIIDHILRLYNCLSINIKVKSIKIDNDITELVLYNNTSAHLNNKNIITPFHYDAGQFVFVNIPTISELEWHPFTISSLPTDDTITNHIKVMGKNEWTEKLNLLGKKNEYNNGQNNLAVNIDGPYGVVLPYEKYNHILFIAGGIGITPLQAQFRFICENYLNDRFNGKSLEKVTLLWSTKTSAEANVFLGKINESMEKDTNGIFQCNIFVTNRDYKNSLENGDSTSSYQQQGTTRVSNNLQLRRATVTLSGHRMDVSSYIQEFAKYGRNSIVYVCGPTSLVDQCMDLSIEHDIEFKQETFLL